MSTLTLSVVTPTENLSLAVNVADSDMERIIAAYRTIHGQVQATDANGDPEVDQNGQAVMRDQTDAEVITSAGKGMLDAVLANVASCEREKALEVAIAGFQPIIATPVGVE